MIRTTGDTIAMSPPLIIEKSEIDDADRQARADVIKAPATGRARRRNERMRAHRRTPSTAACAAAHALRPRLAPVFNPATGEQTGELGLSSAAEVGSRRRGGEGGRARLGRARRR